MPNNFKPTQNNFFFAEIYNKQRKSNESQSGTQHEVQSIVIHPLWDKADLLNDIFAGHDIALIKMKKELSSYTSRMVPICLPDPIKAERL